ncbi:pimeloyl-ACP methyl ester carboxylesterase [Actinomycetospora succinea]|uniref:Pimeloyl-ACP methyl ester carboxylesterase n=1 Tax=Actinomycetospora succinea TaxID=663603 RepID=A0A4R6VGG0_9PSEU|nr:alpha/beta fold hydrolase [Actinomycetospora succinea]TDQ62368.1 pimeloyl-ACP methyl ester carboxylesterase [Actinomycetospora succinea]
MRHGFADTRFGQVHYVDDGAGEPVLLLHQTPRSSDEYRDVLPLLGRQFRAVAPDTPGFGLSDGPTGPWSIELFAAGIVDLCDALGLDRVSLVGHHTGAVVATEIAAAVPERVRALVVSGMPYVDADRRHRVATGRPPIDHVERTDDGAHLRQLWDNRAPYYPADRPDLLERLVRDAVAVIDRVEEGHEAVNRYRMEDRITLVRAATLVLCGELDTFSLPDVAPILAAIPGAVAEVLLGTGVPSVDHRPELFADAVTRFLAQSAS